MGALLDRDVELGELGRRLAEAQAGSGCVIVVAGPAGIGKSTLLAAAGRTARTDGAVEHTRALVALGAALRRANRRADARAPLLRALDQADRGGMLLLAAEHRVAQLAACGHGNRAIAERLYVTSRTVETHLTHAFAELDIRSRAELATALQAG